MGRQTTKHERIGDVFPADTEKAKAAKQKQQYIGIIIGRRLQQDLHCGCHSYWIAPAAIQSCIVLVVSLCFSMYITNNVRIPEDDIYFFFFSNSSSM